MGCSITCILLLCCLFWRRVVVSYVYLFIQTIKTPSRKMLGFQNPTRQNLRKLEPTISRKILEPTLIKTAFTAIMAQKHHYWLVLWTTPICNVFSSETHVIDFRTIWLRPSKLYKNRKASHNDWVWVFCDVH